MAKADTMSLVPSSGYLAEEQALEWGQGEA
jgi:hypothetical protein